MNYWITLQQILYSDMNECLNWNILSWKLNVIHTVTLENLTTFSRRKASSITMSRATTSSAVRKFSALTNAYKTIHKTYRFQGQPHQAILMILWACTGQCHAIAHTNTNITDTVKLCQDYFEFDLPSRRYDWKAKKDIFDPFWCSWTKLALACTWRCIS